MDVFKTLIHSQPGAVGSNVAITGGSVNGTNIGATTPGTGAFTTLTASGATTVTNTTDSSSTSTGALVVTGGAAIAKKTYHGDDVWIVPTASPNETIQLSGTAGSVGESGVWFKQASPSGSNYGIAGTTSYTHVNVASGGTLRLRVANGNYVSLTASALTVENVPIVASNSSNAFRITNSQTPASAGATGTAGTICWDSNYIYVCTATNTWKRNAIATW